MPYDGAEIVSRFILIQLLYREGGEAAWTRDGSLSRLHFTNLDSTLEKIPLMTETTREARVEKVTTKENSERKVSSDLGERDFDSAERSRRHPLMDWNFESGTPFPAGENPQKSRGSRPTGPKGASRRSLHTTARQIMIDGKGGKGREVTSNPSEARKKRMCNLCKTSKKLWKPKFPEDFFRSKFQNGRTDPAENSAMEWPLVVRSWT